MLSGSSHDSELLGASNVQTGMYVGLGTNRMNDIGEDSAYHIGCGCCLRCRAADIQVQGIII